MKRLLNRTSIVAAMVLFVAAVAVVPLATQSAAASPCGAGSNPVECENSKPGTPQSVWDSGDGDASIQGFATDTSVDVGGTISFKVNTPATKYHLDIYRIGYYQGDGARLIATVQPSATLPQTQPACLNDPSTGLIDCGNWAVSASWTVPSTAVSGVYIVHLVRDDGTNGDNQIPFVVRNDASHSDIIYQTSDTTWEAYNDWGGNSLYKGSPAGRAYKVSFNRPYATREDTPGGQDYFMAEEYPMIRWLESNGYDVSYQSGVDTDRAGSLLENHKVFLSVGHDEYWSGNQRANVTAARDAGVNLAFFSGNEVFWKTRYESSIDGSNTSYRTLVCYKETTANAKIDPTSTWTGTWRDPRFSPPSDGGQPENGLTGTIWQVESANDTISIPAAEGKDRFWRNTSLANLAPGTVGSLASSSLGYEWDSDLDNGSRPAGLFDLSSTTLNESQKLLDYGSTVGPGTATHSMTTYRAPSGALVFSAGTVQWSWGLDSTHDAGQLAVTSGWNGVNPPVSKDMQQATVNILADMAAQPTTLASNLVAATQSTDHTPPTAVITSPVAGAGIGNGGTTTVKGTATDAGGGVVAGVEVSMDGGTTWHPATGTTSWTYTGSMDGSGSEPIEARAVDDSGNLQTAVATVNVAVSCPCSMFGLATNPVRPGTPDTASTPDPNATEVGTKFRTDVSGWITGVRFYKGAGNTGTHTGSLWSSTGQLLAKVTFTGESATGWQQATFATPVAVSAGTTYVVSYYAPVGDYASSQGYWRTSGSAQGPVRGLEDGADGANGLYVYGSDSFPTNTYASTNYWVDALFTTTSPGDTTPPTVTTVTPPNGTSSVSTAVAPTVSFSEAVQPATVAFKVTNSGGTAVAGTTTYSSTTNTATFTPTAALAAGTTFTATVSGVKDLAGNTMTSATTWSFKTANAPPAPGVCPCSLWNDTVVPSTITAADPSAVELGVKFTSDVAGTVTGVRFYKGPQNTGTHTGELWSASGTKLATATFTSESTSGWQQVSFSTPVSITANTTYIVSYHTNTGYYSINSGQFSSAGVDNAPLHAPSAASAGGNGVYAYSATSTFPNQTFSGTNYWVDVVFSPSKDITPPSVVSTTPANGSTNVGVSTAISAQLSETIQSGTATMTLAGGGGAVAGTTSYNASTLTASFTPSAALAAGTLYTATVSGAKDVAGNTMAPYSWTFTTAGGSACPCSLFSSSQSPGVAAANDSSSVELGVQFTPSSNGWISGVRFYKGAGNTGVHTGSLWTSSGALITTGTFTGETSSGWQQMLFPTPVQVTGGVTYVASYHAPNGHYAADPNYFTTALTNGPLQAPATNNGVYLYGSGGFPTNTYQSTNYWVDVVFSITQPPDVVPPVVSSVFPVNGATSVPTTAGLTVSFDEPMNPGSIAMSVTGPGGAAAGTVSYNATTFTATFTPTAALAPSTAYTVTATGNDVAGNAMVTAYSWTVTTAAPPPVAGSPPYLLWPDGVGPSPDSVNDPNAVELGVKFRVDVPGTVTAIRFYKGAADVGPHTGSLWSSTGTLLATGTFTGESAAGWQTLTLATPVAIVAGTTYVASFHTASGDYASTPNAFVSAGVDSGPLHALQTGVDGVNGLYLYGSGGFPSAGTSSNYWVEPVFVPSGS